VYDVTGAGDTALAAFAAGIAAGAEREAAAHLANVAAGIAVGKRGTAIVTKEEILEHIEEQELRGAQKPEIKGTQSLLSGQEEKSLWVQEKANGHI
jgi:D-beta-D-heptose 7-phosphate kinase/D-beta-D-heptose 1-phosphate adenosyltransferase